MDFLFGFSGRIGRGRWWLGQLCIVMLLVVVVAAVVASGNFDPRSHRFSGSAVLAFLAGFFLATWINLAVTAKRFHDRGKSGWWNLITFVPYIGSFWILVECGFLRGTDGGNNYGPPPGSGDRNRVADLFDDGEPEVRLAARIAAPLPRTAAEPSTAAPVRTSVPAAGRGAPVGFGRRGSR